MLARQHAPRSSQAPAAPQVSPAADRGNAARLDARRPQPLREFPHRAAIERLLGMALAGRAVVDPEGCATRNAEAFTIGDTAHFASDAPSLHVAAHEAAHVLQHKGLASDGGRGAEDHAEQIADQVERGRSAEALVGKGKTVGGGEKHATKKTKKKSVVLGYFETKDQEKLVDAVEKADLPKDTPVYMGSYGINKSTADAIHGAKGVDGKYAPLFAAVRSKNAATYAGRDDDAKGSKAYAGKIPTIGEILDQKKKGKIKNAQYQAYRWGLELGRRFRDKIREANEKGIGVDSWQFDEVWPFASKEAGGTCAVMREFLRGCIVGLAKGRPEHEDKLMKGVVHVAHFEALADLGNKGEMKSFWRTLGECAQHVVGEEYPGFSGGKAGAEKAAARADAAVDKVGTYGSAGKKVAANYVAGMTPGFRGTSKYSVLGGRAKGQSAKSANDWRDHYVAAREKDGVAGFGEYNWMGESVAHRDDVMDDVGEGLS